MGIELLLWLVERGEFFVFEVGMVLVSFEFCILKYFDEIVESF